MNNFDCYLLVKDLYAVSNNLSRDRAYLSVENRKNRKVLSKRSRFSGFFHSLRMTKSGGKKIENILNHHIKCLNALDRRHFIDENGEATELFIAAHRYNQCIQNRCCQSDSSLEGRVSLPTIYNALVPEIFPTKSLVKERTSVVEGDRPEIVQEKRMFRTHAIRRYPGDRIDHSKEATSIFLTTQLERTASRVGRIVETAGRVCGHDVQCFQKYHYKNQGETEEQIYSKASPVVCTDGSEPTSYWLGHASLLLNLPLCSANGKRAAFNVLVDPVEGDLNALLYPRQTRFARSMDTLPACHVYLLSHNHLDHFDQKAIEKLVSQQAIMVVPKGDGERYTCMGFQHVVELDWWEKQVIELIHNDETYEMKICATPARHWAGQGPCGGHESTFLGYVIEGVEGGDVYVAGDTARLSEDHIAKLRENFDIQWSFQPGGPDEVRKDMESTHQASVDALWMHFNLMVKKRYVEGMSKSDFLHSVYALKTIYMHTMTFKLGNLHLSDTKNSVEKVISALENPVTLENLSLKVYERQVFDELVHFSKEFQFADGELLSLADVAAILRKTVAIPKIGSRIGLKGDFVKEDLFGEKAKS